MKIIQRCNTKRCKTVVSLYNPGIEFTILADNTMLEAARRVHNTFGNRLNYSGNNLPI
jgi:pyoverdine/dityrosine biosynthesis protein Dit1